MNLTRHMESLSSAQTQLFAVSQNSRTLALVVSEENWSCILTVGRAMALWEGQGQENGVFVRNSSVSACSTPCGPKRFERTLSVLYDEETVVAAGPLCVGS